MGEDARATEDVPSRVACLLASRAAPPYHAPHFPPD